MLLVLALAATGISGYLTAVRLSGENAVCGPSRGCEAVAASEYSTVLGIPVAVIGIGFSLLLLALAVTWWRRADRRALVASYVLLLLGTAAVAYLTFLEVFVITAICAWCLSYAVTIVLSLATAGLALRRSG